MMMGGWGWGYGPGAYGGSYWWMGLVGMAIQAVFWVGIIVLGVYLFRRLSPRVSGGAAGHGDALDILRERFARGEIDAEEFQRRRDMLQK